MKKVLVTGVSGMTGSHLAEYIVNKHPDVQLSATKKWRSNTAPIEHFKDKLELIDADLTDPSACDKVIKYVRPDVIFHLAAQSYVLDSWTNPQATMVQNSMMQLNLFEAIREAKIDPIIQLALSSEEYGRVHEHELPITEKNELRPLSPYAVSKVAQDLLGYQYFESYGLKVIRTRAFNHEGPRRGDVFVTSNFAKQIAEIELGVREPIVYVGNLDSVRDWTDVRDMVRAYWLSTEKCIPGEVYVIGSGKSRTIREMLDFLLSQSKEKIEVKQDPNRMRPSDVVRLQADCSKFRNATGWQPEIPFEETMLDILNYWREWCRLRQSWVSRKPGD